VKLGQLGEAELLQASTYLGRGRVGGSSSAWRSSNTSWWWSCSCRRRETRGRSRQPRRNKQQKTQDLSLRETTGGTASLLLCLAPQAPSILRRGPHRVVGPFSAFSEPSCASYEPTCEEHSEPSFAVLCCQGERLKCPWEVAATLPIADFPALSRCPVLSLVLRVPR
jgi:hypothetical protein